MEGPVGFNPRPRTVGDLRRTSMPAGEGMFQPTPTHGGRPQAVTRGCEENEFQPTPTHGGRPVFRCNINSVVIVSTHAHARWATGVLDNDYDLRKVSTHAHARWATICLLQRRRLPYVSTHAHARWATRRLYFDNLHDKRFNPRPRTVGDEQGEIIEIPFNGVSTHAHARWATKVGRDLLIKIIVSTHAHARWATQNLNRDATA